MLDSYLSSRNPDSLVWILGDRNVSSAALIAFRGQFLTQHKPPGRIALDLNNSAALGLALLALDGAVDQLFLLPPDLDANLKTEFLQKTQTELVYSDPQLFLQTLSSSTSSTPETAKKKTKWILATSGTTGTPKLIEHTATTLLRTVKTDVASGSSYKWGLLYDLNRFAGLQVFFQSLAGGSTLLIPNTLSDLGKNLDFFKASDCNALSATPTLWRKILMRPEQQGLELKQITLGGEIAEQKIIDALKARWPKARVVHIYASTEAGVGFSVTDGKAGFPGDWLQSGYRGSEIAISQDGILKLKYPGGAFIETGDRVEVKNDRVYFLGRDSGAINVGGNKVHPEEVERVLLECPIVRSALVSAKKSAFTGSLIQAKVVLKDALAKETAVKQIQDFCRQHLEPYKVPAIVEVVAELETNTMGKVKRSL